MRLKHEALLRALLDGALLQWKHKINGEWHDYSGVVAAASSCIANDGTDLEIRQKPEIKIATLWYNIYLNGSVGFSQSNMDGCIRGRAGTDPRRVAGVMKMTLENNVPVSTEFLPNKEKV